MELFTTPYVFTPDDAVAMARAGADVLVAHMGLTTKGMIGATTRTLEECVSAIQSIHDAAVAERDDGHPIPAFQGRQLASRRLGGYDGKPLE